MIADLLSGPQRKFLVPHIERCTYGENRTIVFRGEVLTRILFLEGGAAAAEYKLRRGMVAIPLRPGDFFGEVAVLEQTACAAEVTSLARDTRVMSMPAELFRKVLEQNGVLRGQFLERVVARRAHLGGGVLGGAQGGPLDPSALRASSAPN